MPKLFIGNVPYTVSDEELSEWIESRGFPLESVHILTYRDTGRSRGFGFAQLQDESQMSEAIASMHLQEMGGRALQVNEANPQPNKARGLAARSKW